MARSQNYSTPFSVRILFPSASFFISIVLHLLKACYFDTPSHTKVQAGFVSSAFHLILLNNNFLKNLIPLGPPSATTIVGITCCPPQLAIKQTPCRLTCSAFISTLNFFFFDSSVPEIKSSSILKTATLISQEASFCHLYFNLSPLCSFVNFLSSFYFSCFSSLAQIYFLTSYSALLGSICASAPNIAIIFYRVILGGEGFYNPSLILSYFSF